MTMEPMPDTDDETVTESCGCVFCDLNLPPELIDGRWVHKSYGRDDVPCIMRRDDCLTSGASGLGGDI